MPASERDRAFFVVADHIRNLRSILDALENDPMDVEHNPSLCHVGSQEFFNLGQFLLEWKQTTKQPN